jgi:hypothetical protein
MITKYRRKVARKGATVSSFEKRRRHRANKAPLALSFVRHRTNHPPMADRRRPRPMR